MDRLTMIQLDKIERTVDEIKRDTQVMTGETAEQVVINFLEQEVYQEEGQLTHLKDDTKLKGFLQELKQEEPEEEPTAE